MKKMVLMVASVLFGLMSYATSSSYVLSFTASGGKKALDATVTYAGTLKPISTAPSWLEKIYFKSNPGQSANLNLETAGSGTASGATIGIQIGSGTTEGTLTFQVAANSTTAAREFSFDLSACLGSTASGTTVTIRQAGVEPKVSFSFVTYAKLKNYSAIKDWPADMFLCTNAAEAVTSFKVGSKPYLYFAFHNTGNVSITNMPYRVDVKDMTSQEIVFTKTSELQGTIPSGSCCYKTDFGLSLGRIGTYSITLTLDPEGTKGNTAKSDTARLITGISVYGDPVYSPGSVAKGSFTPYGSQSVVVGFSSLSSGNFDWNSYPYTMTCDSIPDAEKTSGTGVDYTWCKQLVDVDLLTYGGYAAAAGFANADALADYLRANPTVADGDVVTHVLGLGGYKTTDVRTFLPTTHGNQALLNAFKTGFADGKSLASVGLVFSDGSGNAVLHVVAVCGYMVDSYYAETDPQHLAGIYYIDPDDDKCATPATAPNRIHYCDLWWNATAQRYAAAIDFSWGGIDYCEGELYCDGQTFGYFLNQVGKAPSALPNFAFAKPSNLPDSAFATDSANGTTLKTDFVQGEKAYIRFCVSNLGTGVASCGEVITVALDDAIVGEPAASDVLVAGGSRLSSVEIDTSTIPVGTHEILLVVNNEQTIEETSYDDNVKRVTFTVRKAEDATSQVVVMGEKVAGTYSASITMNGKYAISSSGLPDWVESVDLNVGNSHLALTAKNNWKINSSISGTGTIAIKMTENEAVSGRTATWTIPVADGTASIVVLIGQKGRDEVPPPITTYKVTFVIEHGKRIGGGELEQVIEQGRAAEAPTVEAAGGWTFLGWNTDFSSVNGDLTVTAQWKQNESVEILGTSVANVLDGILYDGADVAGTIQIKTTKATAKGAKLTATITLLGEAKKLSISDAFDASTAAFTGALADGRKLALTIASDEFYGTFDKYEIKGSRNLYSSKTETDKAVVAVADKWIGSYAIACPTEIGHDTYTVTVSKKGKAKISGTLANGTKVSTTAQMIVGSERCVVPVIYSKKGVSLAFCVWFGDDEVSVDGLDGAEIGKAGNLTGSSVLSVDVATIEALVENETTELQTDYIPDGEEIVPSGTKWIAMPDENGKAMKAGKLVWDRSSGEINTEKSKIDGFNVSGLKVTYTAKTGAFKGSFKIYMNVNGSLKTTVASIAGVVIDGVGYGTVTVKKYGTALMMIQQ